MKHSQLLETNSSTFWYKIYRWAQGTEENTCKQSLDRKMTTWSHQDARLTKRSNKVALHEGERINGRLKSKDR